MRKGLFKMEFAGMNLDVDSRLLPDGDYRRALNCRVGSSESNNLGVVENIKGNTEITSYKVYNQSTTNWDDGSLPSGSSYKVIGVFEDRDNDEAYYFIYTEGGDDVIAKIDVQNNIIYQVFASSILNFQSDKLITGVDKINNTLIWTDNFNPQRSIDVSLIHTYVTPHLEAYIDFVKIPPIHPPTTTPLETSTDSSRVLKDEAFVFKMRYVYKDGSKSIFGPESVLQAVSFQNSRDGIDKVYEAIEVDFTDNVEITDTGGSGGENRYAQLIDSIELCYIKEESKTLYLAKKLPFPTNSYEFNDSNSYTLISTDEATTQFHAVPNLCKSLNITRNRVLMANYTEGFDKPTFTVTRNTDVPTVRAVYGSYSKPILPQNMSSSAYKYGVVYSDRSKRNIGVFTDDELILNTYKDIDRVTGISFDITSTPPIWATHYQLVKTNNLTMRNIKPFYLSNNVQYLTEEGETRLTIKENTEKIKINLNRFINRGIGYSVQSGDRIRVFIQNFQTFEVDLEIESFDGEDIVCVWEHIGHVGAKLTGVGVTYTKPTQDDEVFYEIGSVYEINNPGTDLREHSYPYMRSEYGEIFGLTYESSTAGFSYRFISHYPCKEMFLKQNIPYSGRANVELENPKETYKPTGIRFGNPLINDSNINGLYEFSGLNEKVFPNELGEINKLINASDTQEEGDVMLAIFNKDIISIYIQKSILRSTTGIQNVSQSEEFLGAFNVLKGGLGSVHPESIVQISGRVYGFDATKGMFWRYSNDGVTPISNFLVKNYTFDKSREILALGSSGRAFGAYDLYHGEYICTLGEEGGDFETVSFNEQIKRWTTFYSFTPEFYVKVNNRLVSFKDGKPWIHSSNSLYNNFYGVQYGSEMNVVFNPEHNQIKLWQFLSEESKTVWVAETITNDKGQLSEVLSQDFENLEDIFYASFLRDKNTPNIDSPLVPLLNGDELASNDLELKLVNTSTSKELLRNINVGYIILSGHIV